MNRAAIVATHSPGTRLRAVVVASQPRRLRVEEGQREAEKSDSKQLSETQQRHEVRHARVLCAAEQLQHGLRAEGESDHHREIERDQRGVDAGDPLWNARVACLELAIEHGLDRLLCCLEKDLQRTTESHGKRIDADGSE